MIKDIRKHPKIYIEWCDAFTEFGWTEKDTIGENLLCVSIGFLVRENKTSIAVSTSINIDGEFADPLVIPKGMIVKRKRIMV
jgi:hypothetical protein